MNLIKPLYMLNHLLKASHSSLMVAIILFSSLVTSLAMAVGQNPNYVVVRSATGKYGYINTSGNIAITPQFEDANDFNDSGLACVKLNGKYGYINARGNIEITPQFEYVENFTNNGLAKVQLNGKYGYINTNGNIVITPQFKEASGFGENGLAAVKLNGKYGYINTSGNIVITNQFEYAYGFSNNELAIVIVDGKYGYINASGNIVITPQFEDANDFNNSGLARVKLNGKYGYINSRGDWISDYDLPLTAEEKESQTRAKAKVNALYEQAVQLADALRCEDALKLDRQAQGIDGESHSENDKTNGYHISLSSCESERTFKNTLNSKKPQAMYLAAGKYERDGYSSHASEIYEAIISHFPDSVWAVKANDQLNASKRVNDAESTARELQREAERANEEATKEAKSACRSRIASCRSSCGDDYSRFACERRCESICTAF